MPAFLTLLKPADDLLVHGDRAQSNSGSAVAAADLIAGFALRGAAMTPL
jgi:hypothetical protein